MMSKEKIFRFAPSPNGYLHLGHAYSALFTHYWAQKMSAKFLLRIEDIDIGRSRAKFISAIKKDLSWLGIKWSEPVLLQSARFTAYKKATNRLSDKGVLYPCFCTRAVIAKNAKDKDPDGAPLYAKTCKNLNTSIIKEKMANNQPFQLRLDMDKAIEIAGELNIKTAQPNPLAKTKFLKASPSRWGDVVIVRKDIPTSYHLSVVIDDDAQKITHVTRGEDLKAATDVHIILQSLLELETPIYTHHRLIKDETNMKLAKSKHSTPLRDLRASGISAKEIIAQFDFNN